MCVDFIDLNRACLKDSSPLPRVDALVDSTAQHQLLSFMDTFSGYNYIWMDEADQKKTSFVTSQGLFCYKVMLFGLKNIGATYQRLMNKMFVNHIGKDLMSKHYNSRVRHKDFQVGDLVLRKAMGTAKPKGARSQLGGALQDYIMAEERHLPPRDTRRMEVAPSVEHWAPTEVLPVELTARKATLFIFQFTLVDFSNTPQFFSLTLLIFATKLFKPKG